MSLEAKRISFIQEYYFSKKLREIAQRNEKGEGIINLGIGNPDLSPPKAVIEELTAQVQSSGVHGYQSYQGIAQLRAAISKWCQEIYAIELSPEQEILPLIGSKEGIMHISQAFVNKQDKVLIPDPGYPTYSSVSKLIGATRSYYNVDDLQAGQLDKIASEFKNGTKIMWLNFPHMPTGQQPNKDSLSQLIQLAKQHNVLLVNDNPYSTILTDEFFSIFQLNDAKDCCLELNSLSKSHNMAGWRIGWVAGNHRFIQSILKVKSNMDSGMFLPLQKAASKALSVDREWISALNEIYSNRRAIVWKMMDALGCSYSTNQSGLFIWGRIPTKQSSEDFVDELLATTSVFIAPGSIFGANGEQHIRISLCNPKSTLETALKRIEQHIHKTH